MQRQMTHAAAAPPTKDRRLRPCDQAARTVGGPPASIVAANDPERTPRVRPGSARPNPLLSILPPLDATPGSSRAGTAAGRCGASGPRWSGRAARLAKSAPERHSRFRQPQLTSPQRARALQFSIREAAPAADAATQQQQRQRMARLLGDRPAAGEEGIDSTEPEEGQQRQPIEAGAEWTTPGPRLTSAAGSGAADALHAASGAAPPGSRLAPGTAGLPAIGSSSLQRQFLASLPASKAAPLAPARSRAAVGGLESKLLAVLASERALLQRREPPPAAAAGGAEGAVRLTVLARQVEGSLTKCLCQCDPGNALGAERVVALFQSRVAREMALSQGGVVVALPPYRLLPPRHPGQPAVLLCHRAAQQAAAAHYG